MSLPVPSGDAEPRVEPRPVDEADLPTGPPFGSGVLSGCSLGCLSFIALALLFPAAEPVGERMLERPETSEPPAVTLAVCGLPFVVGLAGGLLQRRALARRRRRRKLAELRRRAADEARRRSERARRTWTEAASIAAELPRLAATADGLLDEADRAFAERLFSPFWDRIRAAAERLARLRVALEKLAALDADYRQTLAGQVHNFPEKLLGGVPVPAVGPAVARLGSLTRQGQSDFEFAVIWEHHKTRQILVEGFSTLEAAIEELETTLDRPIERYAAQLSSDFAEASRRTVRALDDLGDDLDQNVERVERLLESRRRDERPES